jgi:hypothetical protein
MCGHLVLLSVTFGLANKEEAISRLQRRYEQKEYEMIALLRRSSMVDPLRQDPGFHAFVNPVLPAEADIWLFDLQKAG